MSKVKIQHYVPQFYLEHFANDDSQVWVFDKSTAKSFLTHVKNIAGEGYFYDFKTGPGSQDEQELEKMFAGLEGAFAPIFQSFIEGIKSGAITALDQSYKNLISKFITMQILRSNETREHNYQLMTGLRDSIIEKFGGTEADLEANGLGAAQLDRKESHLRNVIMNIPARDAIDQALMNHIWVVFVNHSSLPFYTSDHPIARMPHAQHPVLSMSGYNSEGIEIAFPVSPTILIALSERKFFQDLEAIENSVLEITDEQNVIYYNAMQVSDSFRQVFSAADEFELTKEMITTHEYLRDPRRQRVGYD
jgi:hypothetical protein